MLDFTPVRERTTTLHQLTADLTRDELRRLTDEMIDTVLSLIAECTDADVVFMPHDPHAHDASAASSAEVGEAWTLGHVIVHTTAGSEESAWTAAELARGVEFHGRSRYEVPWETVTTIAQCRQRLEESRRMRRASLDLWPDEPHLENTLTLPFLEGPLGPNARFALGLMHDESHLEQIAEIVRQAKAARS